MQGLLRGLLELGSSSPPPSSSARADSWDIYTKRAALKQHSAMVRSDSLSLHKRRLDKLHHDQELEAEEHQQHDRGEGTNCTDGGADVGASGAVDADQALHDSEIKLRDSSSRIPPASRVDSVALAKAKNPRFSRHSAENRPDTAPAAASASSSKGGQGGSGANNFFRQIIHKLTPSRLTGSAAAAATSSSRNEHRHQRRSYSGPDRRHTKSDPGDGTQPREPLHRYNPPPPGVVLRPALARRSVGMAPLPRSQMVRAPTWPGNHAASGELPAVISGATGKTGTFKRASSLSLEAPHHAPTAMSGT